MIDFLFEILIYLDDMIWSYFALALILFSGVYFTIKSRFYQIRVLLKAVKHIKELINCASKESHGVHPMKLYFASVGGMVGLGNLVSIMATVTIGGPGSLFWLWIAAFFGMLMKYSEIYLGIKYREKIGNRYDGGPMYYLRAAFSGSFLAKAAPISVCILLCIYGAEVSQFLILTDTIVELTDVNRLLAISGLLSLVLLSTIGGVAGLANICTAMMPLFMISYLCIGVWIIALNYTLLPEILHTVFISAFTGHAAAGGFVGSTILIAAHYGVSRAVYSGDIGIGYDSIVQSETKTRYPEKQARMAIFALFADSIICTMTIMIVLVTGVWQEVMQPSHYIAAALKNYIPFVNIYIAVIFFIAGFTTIVGYLVVGQKCARFLHPKYGRRFYFLYSIFAFTFFSYFDQSKVILIMSVSGGLLMIINTCGVLKLRNEIKFD